MSSTTHQASETTAPNAPHSALLCPVGIGAIYRLSFLSLLLFSPSGSWRVFSCQPFYCPCPCSYDVSRYRHIDGGRNLQPTGHSSRPSDLSGGGTASAPSACISWASSIGSPTRVMPCKRRLNWQGDSTNGPQMRWQASKSWSTRPAARAFRSSSQRSEIISCATCTMPMRASAFRPFLKRRRPVSYTHLTLPTNREV